ncbi:MAG: BrnA antitoxin family protein [Chlorobiaceae bacterium]|jgi:predicted DNA binding CopG/RHH family protein
MKKKFPDFKTDDEAEAFVETADLSEYDFSGMVPMRFELKRKDTVNQFRQPQELLDAVRINAKRVSIPYQRFMRLAIERAVKPSKHPQHTDGSTQKDQPL